MFTFFNEEEMMNFGEKLSSLLKPGSLLTLDGELGVGKTTFTKGIGKGLGIKRIINSPTFTIVKVYEGRLTLYHFDAYRLEGHDEELGFEEMFDGDGVCVIEWPEFIKDILPDERLEIKMIKNEDESRTLTLIPHGERYVKMIKELEIC